MRICKRKRWVRSGHLEIDREGLTLENLKRLNSLDKNFAQEQSLGMSLIRKIGWNIKSRVLH